MFINIILIIIIFLIIYLIINNTKTLKGGKYKKKNKKKRKKSKNNSKVPIQFITFGGNENNQTQNIKDANTYTKCFKLHNQCLNNNPQNKEKCDLRQCILQENNNKNIKKNKKNKMKEIKEIKSKFEIQVDQDNQEYYNQLFQNINLEQEYLYEPHDKNKYDIYKSL